MTYRIIKDELDMCQIEEYEMLFNVIGDLSKSANEHKIENPLYKKSYLNKCNEVAQGGEATFLAR